jgi:hypothetical protein
LQHKMEPDSSRPLDEPRDAVQSSCSGVFSFWCALGAICILYITIVLTFKFADVDPCSGQPDCLVGTCRVLQRPLLNFSYIANISDLQVSAGAARARKQTEDGVHEPCYVNGKCWFYRQGNAHFQRKNLNLTCNFSNRDTCFPSLNACLRYQVLDVPCNLYPSGQYCIYARGGGSVSQEFSLIYFGCVMGVLTLAHCAFCFQGWRERLACCCACCQD